VKSGGGKLSVKKILRAIKVIIVNLVILFVLLEVASAAIYFFKTREFFYTRSGERIAATKNQFEPVSQASGEGSAPNYQIHPYFGFINRKGGYVDLPYKRVNNQYIIGVFGGSVAQQYYAYEHEQRDLIKALQQLPQFQNREIVVLRFTHEAYKQPQQLLVLNYFLSLGQELDMAINIDGFNELALADFNNKNGIDFSMPVGFLMTPLVDLADKDFSPEQVDLALEVMQTKQKLKYALDRLSACKLAVCYSLRWAQTKYLFGQYQAKSVAFAAVRQAGQKSSLVHVNRLATPLKDEELLDRAVDEWANSSRTMHDILTAKKIAYFEFIQPNQYFPTNRRFSDEEKKIAMQQNAGNMAPISAGYGKLLARLPDMQASGMKIFSAVRIFDETSDIVYLDNCCHYNKAGLTILSEYVARSIVMAQPKADKSLK
jgi:hypothetical protein